MLDKDAKRKLTAGLHQIVAYTCGHQELLLFPVNWLPDSKVEAIEYLCTDQNQI